MGTHQVMPGPVLGTIVGQSSYDGPDSSLGIGLPGIVGSSYGMYSLLSNAVRGKAGCGRIVQGRAGPLHAAGKRGAH